MSVCLQCGGDGLETWCACCGNTVGMCCAGHMDCVGAGGRSQVTKPCRACNGTGQIMETMANPLADLDLLDFRPAERATEFPVYGDGEDDGGGCRYPLENDPHAGSFVDPDTGEDCSGLCIPPRP